MGGWGDGGRGGGIDVLYCIVLKYNTKQKKMKRKRVKKNKKWKKRRKEGMKEERKE